AGENIASGGHAISIGTVVAFTTLQTRVLFPIQSLLSVGLEVQTSLALFGRIFEYLDLPVDIQERADARTLRGVRGDVQLRGVWFTYAADGAPEPALDGMDLDQAESNPLQNGTQPATEVSGAARQKWTLREVSAEIPAGTRTALVGETGSGKTTLAYLVARLYEPQ